MLIPADTTSTVLTSDELKLSYRQLEAGIINAICEKSSPMHYYGLLELCRRLLSRYDDSAKMVIYEGQYLSYRWLILRYTHVTSTWKLMWQFIYSVYTMC